MSRPSGLGNGAARPSSSRRPSRTDGSASYGRVRSCVRVRPPVTIELPRVSDLGDLVEVEVADDQLLVVGGAELADELAARVDEIALAVEVVVADVGLDADPVDRPDVVAVGDRVADLLDPPQVLGQAARGRARDEHDLGAVEAERPGAFGEVAVVADVHADLADRGLEDRVAEVARPEVELLPEPLDVRDVGLAVLAEVRPVRVDHGGRVVVDARGLLVLLVHRGDDDHAGLLGEVLHPLGRRSVGDVLGVAVVLGVLHLAEVRPVEQLLEQDELGTLLGRLVRVALVLLDHRFLVAGPARLDERTADGSGHRGSPHSRGLRSKGQRVHRDGTRRDALFSRAGPPAVVACTTR